MNVTRLEPFSRNLEIVRMTAQPRPRRFDGFLHDVAKGTCELQLAAAGHLSRLYKKDVATRRSPRKANRDTGL